MTADDLERLALLFDSYAEAYRDLDAVPNADAIMRTWARAATMVRAMADE